MKGYMACVLSYLSLEWLFVTLWTVALQASVRGILQTRILEWVSTPPSRVSSPLRYQNHVSCVSCLGRWVLYHSCHLGSPGCMAAVSKKWRGSGGSVSGQESTCQCRICGFHSLVRRNPQRSKCLTLIFVPGNPMNKKRSLADCSPWGSKRVGHDLVTETTTAM